MNKRNIRLAATISMLVLAAGAVGTCSIASAATGGPTVVLSSTSASTTSAAMIPVTATFSEPVSGASLSGISATNATAENFTGSGAVYTFDIAPSSQGTTSVMILADSASSTATGIGNQASNSLTFNGSTNTTGTTTAPVISETAGIASTTTSSTPSYSFTSSEAGAIGLTGGCASPTTMATAGSNTITFAALANGAYSCSLTVMNSGGLTSNSLPINFTVSAASSTSGGPAISGIQETSTGPDTATITWTTDVAATGQVMYGSTTSYDSMSTVDTTESTSHTAYLGGLMDGSTYHFAIVSGDSAGTSTSPDQIFVGGINSAATSTDATSTPLALDGVDAVNSTATADGTFADGWSWLLHFTVPDAETSFQLRFNDFANGSGGTIPIANNMRYFSAQSSNAASSSAAIVEANNDYGGALMLTGDSDPSTAGRQVDVMLQVAVPFGTSPGSYSTVFGAFSTTSSATSTQ